MASQVHDGDVVKILGMKKFNQYRRHMAPMCPDCNMPMIRITSSVHRDRAGKAKMFWKCINAWCTYRVSAHPSGRPVGIPANVEMRQARIQLHDTMAKKFFGRPWKESTKQQRNEVYMWMKMHAPKPHVGWMTLEECKQTISLINKIL